MILSPGFGRPTILCAYICRGGRGFEEAQPLQLVDVSNAPFLRPELDAVLGGIGYVRKPRAERHDPFGKSHPIRGTHIPSQ